MRVRSVLRKGKGQSFMPDFLASIVIFSLVITIFLSSWSSVVSHHGEAEVESLLMQADHTSTFLVTTPGYPEDWDRDNVEIVGFAEEENILDLEKIQEFGEIDYGEQRRLMRARDFYLEFENSSSEEREILEINGEELFYGEDFDDPDFVYPVKRTVKIDDSGDLYEAEMNYVIYR